MKVRLPKQKYNVFAKEIMRATDVILKRKLESIGESFETMINERFKDRITKRDECELVKAISDFVCLFLENDNAYRFRIQDGFFGKLNKDNILKFGVVYEVKRLLNILIEREIDVKQKFIGLKRIAIPLLIISPEIKSWLTRFLLEIDVDKLKLDEHDWYFCLRRRGYKFGGISLEERLKEKEIIDKEKGHIMLKLIRKEDFDKMKGTATIAEGTTTIKLINGKI